MPDLKKEGGGGGGGGGETSIKMKMKNTILLPDSSSGQSFIYLSSFWWSLKRNKYLQKLQIFTKNSSTKILLLRTHHLYNNYITFSIPYFLLY